MNGQHVAAHVAEDGILAIAALSASRPTAGSPAWEARAKSIPAMSSPAVGCNAFLAHGQAGLVVMERVHFSGTVIAGFRSLALMAAGVLGPPVSLRAAPPTGLPIVLFRNGITGATVTSTVMEGSKCEIAK
mmetsp:Transcript_67688/g.159360  ORF Transcript_67688/g.159360 Transcript_67688/m.159360 type:complete len:131 (+) Transcript_67688:916-1308(+)